MRPPATRQRPVARRLETRCARSRICCAALADTPLPVLITGETGVGKEVVRALPPRRSARADAPFMAVNCAAIPADLLESEIFGHERGAFTGAASAPSRLCRAGESGTLFLDEIGDLPLRCRASCCVCLEDGSFLRVGGETPVPFHGAHRCRLEPRSPELPSHRAFPRGSVFPAECRSRSRCRRSATGQKIFLG